MRFSSALRAVALFEAAKGILVILVGFGLLSLIHHDAQHFAERLVAHAHLNPASRYPRIFLDIAGQMTDGRLLLLALGAGTYAGARLVEAYGLWFGRLWAEWFAALSGGIYIPFELFEIYERASWIGVVALLLNLAIVAFMALSLLRARQGNSENAARQRVHTPDPRLSLRAQLLGLAAWLGLTFACAAIGAVASAQAAAFYLQLQRPAWAPPAWLFAPVWSALYFLMAVAAWLVWRAHGLRRARAALGLFVSQLAANAIWTWLFFVWNQGALAFGEIVLLWALIAGTVAAFWRLHPLAGLLLVPYLAWVTFASALTFAVWKLNPGILT